MFDEINFNEMHGGVFGYQPNNTDSSTDENLQSPEEIERSIKTMFDYINCKNIDEVCLRTQSVLENIFENFSEYLFMEKECICLSIDLAAEKINKCIGDSNVSKSLALIGFIYVNNSYQEKKNPSYYDKVFQEVLSNYKTKTNRNFNEDRLFFIVKNQLPLHLLKSIFEVGNVKAKDNFGRNLLHWAVISNHPKMVRILCACDVDFYEKDKFNLKPIDYAKSWNIRKIINDSISRRFIGKGENPKFIPITQKEGLGEVKIITEKSFVSVFR